MLLYYSYVFLHACNFLYEGDISKSQFADAAVLQQFDSSSCELHTCCIIIMYYTVLT